MLGRDVPRLHVAGTCTRLVHEFTHYVWEFKKRTEEQETRQKPIKRDDHMMDCLRYILAGNPSYINRTEFDTAEDGPSFKGTYTKYPSKETSGKTAYHDLVNS
jgi:hypothetical protein